LPSVRKLIYSMSLTLDGYIAGPDGGFDWGAPDEELHRFHNQRVAELDAQLLGRRLYETMLVWETDPPPGEVAHEFAEVWSRLERVVFSTTLDAVQGSARLAIAPIAEEVARLRARPGGDIGVGGAGLAASLIRLGLVDEYQLFVCPIVVGGGTPFFPALEAPIDLELVETRTFSSRVVYLHYRSTGA
jgi:dihydrofolate reductase